MTASGGTTLFTEGSNVVSTPVILDGALTVSDPDSTTLADARTWIGAGRQAAKDVLGFTCNPATMGNITGSYNAGTGVLTLSSAGNTATPAQFAAALAFARGAGAATLSDPDVVIVGAGAAGLGGGAQAAGP